MKKNIILKVLSFLIALSIFITASACRKEVENSSSGIPQITETNKSRDYLTLLYSSADTFNPYTAKTDINRQVCQLIFDPLVSLDSEYNPVYKIAKNVSVGGKTCTVNLNEIRFSDGSMLTADDVVYSYKLAKNTSGVYSASLYEVNSVSAKNSSTVIFTLTKADPYFINNLTFPIIKSGSEKISDSDSVLQPPIGSGRFKVSEDKLSLTANEHYYKKSGNIINIKLINAPDIDSVAHYVEVGASDIYYNSISDGNILRMSGKKLDVPLNNLIYIGINQNYGALSNTILRQALSSGIDRKKICNDSFYNNAIAANGFFNPVWNETKSVQNIQIEANSQITVENLEKIGYNNLDNKNNVVNSRGAKLNFTLLVNSENRLKVAAAQQVAGQLKNYGINITVIEKNYEQYLDLLKNGNFQLFLGEVKLTDNMDISSMVLSGGSAAYGLKSTKTDNKTNKNSSEKSDSETLPENQDKSETTDENTEQLTNNIPVVLDGFYSGKNTVADVATVLQTEMPFIPICYRTGVLFYNENIENVNNSSVSDIYFSIESYIYNK